MSIQIQPEEFTFGRSLNIGFKATEGEIVVPLSAHAFPCNQYWLQILKSVQDLKGRKPSWIIGFGSATVGMKISQQCHCSKLQTC
jgi:hypothetical protein